MKVAKYRCNPLRVGGPVGNRPELIPRGNDRLLIIFKTWTIYVPRASYVPRDHRVSNFLKIWIFLEWTKYMENWKNIFFLLDVNTYCNHQPDSPSTILGMIFWDIQFWNWLPQRGVPIVLRFSYTYHALALHSGTILLRSAIK